MRTLQNETVSESVTGFILRLAESGENIHYITADGNLPGIDAFRAKFPERYTNVGIAEQNAMAIASGLALTGKTVYVWNNSTFLLYRPFDQVRIDAAFANTRLRLIGTSAGLTRSMTGIAHVTVEDLAVTRALPNMTVVCPGDRTELTALLQQCHDVDGPVYLRLPMERDVLPDLHAPGTPITLGRAAVVDEGGDAALIVTGHVLEKAARWVAEWRRRGLAVELVSMPTVKPLDRGCVERLVAAGKPLLTLEEHSVIGGLGSAVAEAVAEAGSGVPFRRVGIPDRYPYVAGSAEYLWPHLGIPEPDELFDWIVAHRDGSPARGEDHARRP